MLSSSVAHSFARSTGPLRATSSLRAAAAAPALTAVVKGDPAAHKHLDCPFCHRVLLTLEAKGIPYNMEMIDFANKPQWVMDASGGKVPIIKVPSDNDLILPDSDVIVKYLEDKYPTPSMVSSVPSDIGSSLYGAGREFVKATGDDIEVKKAVLCAELAKLEAYLAGMPGPLFGGASMNAHDANVAPKLYHLIVALPYFAGFSVEASKYPAVHKYFSAVTTLDAWKNADYGADTIISGWIGHGFTVRK